MEIKNLSEQMAEILNSLTDEQKEKAKACKTQEELTVLQEQENNRSQAAARVRATMQELVQQYGRFGQSLEEASEQMSTLQ